MRRADHDARRSADRSRDARDRRRWNDTKRNGIAPHRGDPGNERGLQHRSRQAGVSPDNDWAARLSLIRKQTCGGAPDSQREFRSELDVRYAPHAIGAKEPAHFAGAVPCEKRTCTRTRFGESDISVSSAPEASIATGRTISSTAFG